MVFLLISLIFLFISLFILVKSYKLNKQTKLLLSSNISPEDMQKIFDFYLKD